MSYLPRFGLELTLPSNRWLSSLSRSFQYISLALILTLSSWQIKISLMEGNNLYQVFDIVLKIVIHLDQKSLIFKLIRAMQPVRKRHSMPGVCPPPPPTHKKIPAYHILGR